MRAGTTRHSPADHFALSVGSLEISQTQESKTMHESSIVQVMFV